MCLKADLKMRRWWLINSIAPALLTAQVRFPRIISSGLPPRGVQVDAEDALAEIAEDKD
jgi:hypothetical protein